MPFAAFRTEIRVGMVVHGMRHLIDKFRSHQRSEHVILRERRKERERERERERGGQMLISVRDMSILLVRL